MKNVIAIACLLLLSTSAFSQKVKVIEGDFKNLKGINEYNLVFDYSNLSIPKYKSEEEFLEDKMAKRDDKDPEAGEKFKESWFADRENRYEPRFIESFNKRFGDGEVRVGDFPEAPYTMKVHTTLMWAGYNVGVWRENSKIEATVSVYKTDNPNDILFSAEFTRVEGGSFTGTDFNSGDRIAEAYAKLAKKLSSEIKRKAK